jgi:DNA-binding GntR family transcriptional regulator
MAWKQAWRTVVGQLADGKKAGTRLRRLATAHPPCFASGPKNLTGGAGLESTHANWLKTMTDRRREDRPGTLPANSPAKSVVESIIRRVKTDVQNGNYAPGQRLIEADLQDVTGASRGPIREAMKRLAAEGLIEIQHRKGARVRRLTHREIENLYDVREILEGFAASRAAARSDNPTFRAGITKLEERFKKKFDGSPQAYMDYNGAFHAFIVQHSENGDLIRLVSELHVPIFMLRLYHIIDRAFIKRAHDEHDEIIKHLLEGDAVRAERAMRKHIRSTKATVLDRTA